MEPDPSSAQHNRLVAGDLQEVQNFLVESARLCQFVPTDCVTQVLLETKHGQQESYVVVDLNSFHLESASSRKKDYFREPHV